MLQAATDASKLGGGVVLRNERHTRWWTRYEARYHINVLETLMILHLLEEFIQQLRGSRLLVWCDNSTAVRAINKGASRSNVVVGIMRRIRLLCLEHDVWLWVAHIPGVLNVEADGLSRGLLAR